VEPKRLFLIQEPFAPECAIEQAWAAGHSLLLARWAQSIYRSYCRTLRRRAAVSHSAGTADHPVEPQPVMLPRIEAQPKVVQPGIARRVFRQKSHVRSFHRISILGAAVSTFWTGCRCHIFSFQPGDAGLPALTGLTDHSLIRHHGDIIR
jgi:hypothetical protein